MPSEDWKFVSRVENLRRLLNLIKVQGFETPEEMFIVGYLTAHGGEKYFLNQVTHDIELLAENPEFWKPIVEDCHRIRLKVLDDDIEAANTLLIQLLEQRKARLPTWLKGNHKGGLK
jgi:hypothetical protein